MTQMPSTPASGNTVQEDQPRFTFFLFAYNQEKYIEEACQAALAQTYSPLEIIFSDDCSSDRTFELMETAARRYAGPHQVKLNRNQTNLGLINHVNKSFHLSSGDLIVAAAGDDISLPERVQCLADEYERHGRKPLVIHSSATRIGDSGADLGIYIPPVAASLMTLAEMADRRALYIGATGAWSKALYQEFGPISFSHAYEDLVLGFRAAMKSALLYVDKPLVRYRVSVGMSAKITIPLANVRARVALRRKHLNIVHDVYAQRRGDLDKTPALDQGGILRAILDRNVKLCAERILFYRNPLAVLLHVLSGNFSVAVRALRSEVRFLCGLIDYSD